MQILTPHPEARVDGEFAVEPFGTKGSAGIYLSGDRQTVLVMQDIEDADRLIKAAVEAKRLLLAEPLPCDPVAPRCESRHAIGDNPLLQCSLEQDHTPRRHAAYTPGDFIIAAWDDDDAWAGETPEPDACKCGHPGRAHVYYAPQPCTQCECTAFTAPVTETAGSAK